MHKIGIISDIHGNDIAFKKVLELLNGNVDEIICLGDMIGIGPNSHNVLSIASKLDNFSTVLGNHERYYLLGFDNPLSCIDSTHQEWVKKEIGSEFDDYIRSIPKQIVRHYNGHKLLFIHYAMRDLEIPRFQVIEKNVNYDNLVNVFRLHDFDYAFYGHEHIGSIVKGESNGKVFINPGSLGCPHPDTNKGRYGILTIGEDITYENYEFTYDPLPIIEDLKKKKTPSGEFIMKAFFHYDNYDSKI